MSTTYTGVGSNVTQTVNPTIDIPVDGQARTANDVNTPLKKLIDYVALLWAGIFTGTGTNPGLTSTGGPGGAPGIASQGTGTSPGLTSVGGTSGNPPGLSSTGGGPNGNGAEATGSGGGAGGKFTGGPTSGSGVQGQGVGGGVGVTGQGGTSNGSIGVSGVAGNDDGYGLAAIPHTSTAIRPAFHLSQQIFPINCQPGDIWWDGTNFKCCKVAGVPTTIV